MKKQKRKITHKDIIGCYDFLIENYYPELKDVAIHYSLSEKKYIFMYVKLSSYNLYKKNGYKIFIHKETLEIPKDAFLGCLAHELEHICTQHFEREGKYDLAQQNEAETDCRVVARGLGDYLIALRKYADSFEKLTNSPNLSVSEIEHFKSYFAKVQFK